MQDVRFIASRNFGADPIYDFSESDELVARVEQEKFAEVILALAADVEGEATTNYLVELLKPTGVTITRTMADITINWTSKEARRVSDRA